MNRQADETIREVDALPKQLSINGIPYISGDVFPEQSNVVKVDLQDEAQNGNPRNLNDPRSSDNACFSPRNLSQRGNASVTQSPGQLTPKKQPQIRFDTLAPPNFNQFASMQNIGARMNSPNNAHRPQPGSQRFITDTQDKDWQNSRQVPTSPLQNTAQFPTYSNPDQGQAQPI